MELFGIILSVPVAFVMSMVYCAMLAHALRRVEFLRRWLFAVSLVLLTGFVGEVLLLATVGAVGSRALVGPAFYVAHSVFFFLGTPALANVLLLPKRRPVIEAIEMLSMRLSGLVTLTAALLLLVVGIAVSDQPNKPCREHPNLIAPCFDVHARMRYYNGAPSVRLWPIGTDRLLGVSDGRFAVVGYQNLPYSLRETLDRRREIYADFVVCPFTPSEPGVMRLVCVDSARKIVTKPVAAW